MWEIILFSLIAGGLGTGLGGIIGVIVSRPGKQYIAFMFAFAAGVMLGLVFIDLLPTAQALGGLEHTCIGLGAGFLFVFIIKRNDGSDKHTPIQDPHDLFVREDHDHKRMFFMGIAIVTAMLLHDIPEGMIIGASGRIGAGLAAGIMIMLHSIPEGMAMAVPFHSSGVKRWKIVGICFLAGIPSVIGAIIGYAIGVSDILIAYSLLIACGAMLCIVFMEMMPTVYEYTTKRKLPAIALIAGVVLAIVLESVL